MADFPDVETRLVHVGVPAAMASAIAAEVPDIRTATRTRNGLAAVVIVAAVTLSIILMPAFLILGFWLGRGAQECRIGSFGTTEIAMLLQLNAIFSGVLLVQWQWLKRATHRTRMRFLAARLLTFYSLGVGPAPMQRLLEKYPETISADDVLRIDLAQRIRFWSWGWIGIQAAALAVLLIAPDPTRPLAFPCDSPRIVYPNRSPPMSATVSIENDIALVTLDDGKANAISLDLLAAANTALDEAEAKAKVIVLAGRPERFSAGFDLKFLATADPVNRAKLVNGGGRLALRLFTSEKPIVIACTGHAIAMGAFLLLGGDTRIGARGAYKIGANETVNNMTLPPFGVELPRARLNPMYLTEALAQARLYTPDEAVPVGWLDRVVEPGEVIGAALAEAARLLPLANDAYGRNKRLARQPTIDLLTPTLAG